MRDEDTIGHCAADTHCKAYDHLERHPAWTAGAPLCDTCLTVAARDVRTLTYDYVDLAQLQDPTLSQALNTQPGGRLEPPMPLKAAPDALQREIWHVATLWEVEVRAATGLPDLPPLAQHGAAVQRAVTVLHPRLRALACLPATTVYPTGCEDPPQDVTGWEAVLHLQRLRARARSMLGRVQRSHWVPGDCWQCDGRDADDADGPLYRPDPREAEDEVLIWCDRCHHQRTWDDYQTYLTTLVWPGSPVEVAA